VGFFQAMVFLALAGSVTAGGVITGGIIIANRMVRKAGTIPPPRQIQAPHIKASGGVPASSFWHWATTMTYLLVVWTVERLLIRVGGNLHTQPGPFILFGLSLGLALTILEWEWDAKKQDSHTPVASEAA
jgi:hypothetical protein